MRVLIIFLLKVLCCIPALIGDWMAIILSLVLWDGKFVERTEQVKWIWEKQSK